jgi:hypothetical protein
VLHAHAPARHGCQASHYSIPAGHELLPVLLAHLRLFLFFPGISQPSWRLIYLLGGRRSSMHKFDWWASPTTCGHWHLQWHLHAT